MSDKIKVAVLETVAKPFIVKEVDEPTIKKMGQVKVRTLYCGVSNIDQLIFLGNSPVLPPTPYTPGAGSIGIVEECSEDVYGIKNGDLVFVSSWYKVPTNNKSVSAGGIIVGLFPTNPELGNVLINLYKNGGLAEKQIYPMEIVHTLPDSFKKYSLCQLMLLKYLCVALGALEKTEFKVGEVVLVNGATGRYGRCVVELALAIGAKKVFCVARNGEKLQKMFGERARCECISDESKIPKNCVDVYIDFLQMVRDPPSVNHAIESLRFGGRAGLCGGTQTNLKIPYFSMVTKQISIRGSLMFEMIKTPQRLIQMITGGLLKLENIELAERAYTLDKVNDCCSDSLNKNQEYFAVKFGDIPVPVEQKQEKVTIEDQIEEKVSEKEKVKAVLLNELGKPMEIKELPVPISKYEGVLVKVGVSYILNFSKYVFGGMIPMKPATPMIPGVACIGMIEKTAPDVVGLKENSLCFVSPWMVEETNDLPVSLITGWFGITAQKDSNLMIEWGKNGSWTSKQLFHKSCVYPLPRNFKDRFAMNDLAMINYYCITLGAVKKSNFKNGGKAMVIGSTGHLGTCAVNCFLALEASQVYCVGRTEEKLKKVFGGFTEEEQKRLVFVTSVKEYPKMKCDAIVDFMGSVPNTELTEGALGALKPGGSFVFGGGVQGDIKVNYGNLLGNGQRITGSLMYGEEIPQLVIKLIDNGALKIPKREFVNFPLEKVNEAVESAANNKDKYHVLVINKSL